MNTYILVGLIGGGGFVILVLALCKMSARCSPAEQVAMDDEQARAMANLRLERKLKKISANEKWQARWKDDQPPGIGKGW